MKKARLSILLLALIVFAALFGCSPAQNGAQQSTGQTTQAAARDKSSEAATRKESESAEKKDTDRETTERSSEEKTTEEALPEETTEAATAGQTVSEDGEYSSKEEVAEYIHLYGHLPSNFISKSKAEKLGWNSSKGNLWDVAYGKSIGGGKFGNYEGLLPKANGRTYYECDIDFDGRYRNSKRIVYSNDGLVFYTEDHYKTFEQLY